MAPEQAAGQVRQIGPAADVYALGAILYECLTGRPPFRAATPLDTVLQVVSEEPVAPTQLQPKLPRDLETICLKCLRKEPDKRYATAQDLADELGRFLNGDPILARPSAWHERTRRWVKKHPGKSAMIAASVFAVSFVIGIQYAGNVRERERGAALQRANDIATAQKAEAERSATEARQARDQADAARRQSVNAERTTREARKDAVDQLYAARIDLAYREWQQNNVYRTEQLLNECPADLRGWEWDYLKGLCRPERMTLHGHVATVERIAVSPDGTHLLSSDAQSAHYWDLTSGRELFSRDKGGPVAISPDGRRLALAGGSAVWVLDERDGREEFVLHEGDDKGRVIAVAFADVGRQIVTVTFEDHAVHRWDAATGRKLATVTFRAPFHRNNASFPPSLSRDGTRLAEGSDGGWVRVWDTATGQVAHEFMDAPLMHATSTAFSPRGDRLAASWAEGTVMVWELPSGKMERRWRAHPSGINRLTFSADGRRLATGSDDQSIRLWDLSTFEELLVLRGHVGGIASLCFTPDGRQLVSSAAEAIKVWDLSERRYFGGTRALDMIRLQLNGRNPILPPGDLGYRTYYGHVGPTRTVTFSPDSRLAVTTSNGDGTLAVWDLTTNICKHVLVVAHAAYRPSAVTFTPDSKSFLAVTPMPNDTDSEARLWDVATGRELLHRKGLFGDATGVVILPDGKTAVLALATDRGSRLVWWALPDGHELGAPVDLDGQRVHSLGLTAEVPPGATERLLVVGGSGGWTNAGERPLSTVTLLDTAARQVLRSFKVPMMTALAVGKGGLVATAHAHPDMLIRLFDVATGAEVRPLEGHTAPVESLAFSPDGKRLVSAGGDGDQAIKVWNVANGRELLTFREHVRRIERVAWSPDGRKIASASWDHTLRVWEPAADPARDTDRWRQLFVDRFGRAEPGPSWLVGKNWSIENGALRGVLVDTSIPPGSEKFETAQATLAGPGLPDTVEVRLDCWTLQPMVCEAMLVNSRTGLTIHPMLVGTRAQFGFTGAGLLLMRGSGAQGSLVGVPRTNFEFVPGKRYHVRILREQGLLTMTVNGERMFREAIPGGPTPTLVLQGGWGRAGDVVYFANLEVRAPEAAVREQVLRDRLEAWFDRFRLHSRVEEEIARDGSLSDSERRFLRAQLPALPENGRDLVGASGVVLKPGATREVYALALRQAGEAVRLLPADGEGRLLLAAAQYRVGDYAAADAALTAFLELHRKQNNCSHPGALALRAMIRHRLNRPDAAADLRQARDMFWGDRWLRDEPAGAFVKEAEALLGVPAPHDEAEAIKAVVFRSESAGWQHNDLRAYLAAYADDVEVLEARAEAPSEYDVRHDRRRLEEVRRLQFPVSAATEIQLSYEDVQIRVEGVQAECRFLQTASLGGWFRTSRTTVRLRKRPQGWRIVRFHSWPLAEMEDGVRRFDAAHWKAKDEAVEKARKAGDGRRLATALEKAQQYAETLAVARQLTASKDATAEDWALYGRTAFVLGRIEDARNAFRTARARKPTVELPWYLSRHRRTLHAATTVLGADWSPDGRMIAAGGIDGQLFVWDVASGRDQRIAAHLNWIWRVAFQPHGPLVATAGGDHFVKFWDLAMGREVRTLSGHNARVFCVTFDHAGRRLVSASADRTVRVWDLATGSEQLVLRHPDLVTSAVFSPDGGMLATACRDGTVRTWDPSTGRLVQTLRGHTNVVWDVVYSPDGTRLASAGFDQTVRVWDAASGRELHKLSGHRKEVQAIAFSPDGRRLVSGSNDGVILLWDVAGGKLLEVLGGQGGSVFGLVFSPDGRRLASACGDGGVRLWDMTDW
jgi:WD40 repeat protein